MKLEIKHLAPYLPHSLKCVYPEKYDEIFILVGLRNPYKTVNKWFLTTELRLDKSTKIHSHVFNTEKPEVNFKPILRPLSQLKDFSPAIWKYGMLESELLPMVKLTYNEINVLFENHFDVFGLIEKGLAIDINSIENHS